ncbi:type IV pilin-like G/H family protein [Leptolyngbya sp. FACHB-36]|uniref:type IV pilin-like G/H family protein n=1 Tax=Leptolyngbya sp. FACHB-36 TaxID=2692808 RepID=UPI001681AE3A|nr:type IV pilin-like G/H family protein [Leptolyngbya sp. FACHB-36]MBD2021425.1 type IV pilin-like G/H family protein [Leptolyngbya sp. FACHB-36]
MGMRNAAKWSCCITVVALLSACNTLQRPFGGAVRSPDRTASPLVSSPSLTSLPSPSISPTFPDNPFQKATDRAASASTLAQSAQTGEDWTLVLSHWQEAIALLKAVPPASRDRAAAQKLLPEYRQSLIRAQQQAKRGPNPTTIAKPDSGGIPLIASDAPITSAPESPAQEDAKRILNELNQRQTSFFQAQKRFAANLEELGSNFAAETENYAFRIASAQLNQAVATATAKQDGLRSYASAIVVVKGEKNDDRPLTRLCETRQPSKTPPAAPRLVNNELQCPTAQ